MNREDPFKYVITWENIAEERRKFIFVFILQFLKKTIKKVQQKRSIHRSASWERNEMRRLCGESF